jgi:cytochrome c oxidase subunit 2
MKTCLAPAITLVILSVTWLAGAAPVVAQEATAPKIEVKIDGEYGAWFPPDVSAHGHEIDTLIIVLMVFTVITFVGWSVFLFYCLYRFRSRPGHQAAYGSRWKYCHIYFVVAVAIFELALDGGLSNPVMARVKDKPPDGADVVVVRVMAEQFAWTFHYPGKDGVFGRTSPGLVNGATNPLGIDPKDPNGEDDIVSSELHIPVDRPVITELTAKDVIHSFFIPVMRVKQDAIPGMRIPIWFEGKKRGNYEIACAELCGNNHYSMRALMVIQSSGEFDAWLAEKGAAPEEFLED